MNISSPSFLDDLPGEPGPMKDALRERLEEWRPHFIIETDEEKFYFMTMVASRLQVEQIRSEEVAVRNHMTRRARLCWDLDRFREAVVLGSKLAKDPEKIAHELTRSRHGAEWLLKRWERLAAALETQGEWTPAQSSLAFDLMGLPEVFRNGQDPWLPGETPRKTVERETAILRQLKAIGLDELDASRRELAEEGFDPEANPHINTLRRQEQALVRRFMWAMSRLRRRDPDAVDAPRPMPVAPPPPPPPPPPPANPEPPTEADVEAFERDFWQNLLTGDQPNFLDTLAHMAGKPAPATPAAPLPFAAAPAPASINRRHRRAAAHAPKSRRGR